MLNPIRFFVLAMIKVLGAIFFRLEVTIVGPMPPDKFHNVRIAMILNHTSLYEPIFFGAVPFYSLWEVASRAVLPTADVTLGRPILGRFFKLLAPQVVTLTRRRDSTWTDFLAAVKPDSLILIAPEGRMKRPNGLDKDGKPMTVRGGIADLIYLLDRGKMLIGYSGGLHHVQAPGQKFPKLFKEIRLAWEIIDIADYKAQIGEYADRRRFKQAVVQDLEARRDRYVPTQERGLVDERLDFKKT